MHGDRGALALEMRRPPRTRSAPIRASSRTRCVTEALSTVWDAANSSSWASSIGSSRYSKSITIASCATTRALCRTCRPHPAGTSAAGVRHPPTTRRPAAGGRTCPDGGDARPLRGAGARRRGVVRRSRMPSSRSRSRSSTATTAGDPLVAEGDREGLACSQVRRYPEHVQSRPVLADPPAERLGLLLAGRRERHIGVPDVDGDLDRDLRVRRRSPPSWRRSRRAGRATVQSPPSRQATAARRVGDRP